MLSSDMLFCLCINFIFIFFFFSQGPLQVFRQRESDLLRWFQRVDFKTLRESTFYCFFIFIKQFSHSSEMRLLLRVSKIGIISQQARHYRLKVPKDLEAVVPVPSLHTYTMRVKDPIESLPFYKNILGLEVLHILDVHQNGFRIYYMGARDELRCTPARMKKVPGLESVDANTSHRPGTMDASDYLYHLHTCVLELIHVRGTEEDHKFKISTGNDPPHLGFGGITLQVDNVANICRRLHQNKVKITAEPTAEDASILIQDPDGYAIRLIERQSSVFYSNAKLTPTSLSSCRLRVKDPKASVPFFERFFLMRVVCVHTIGDITRYYMACRAQLDAEGVSDMLFDPRSEDAFTILKTLRVPTIELQHHKGTENYETKYPYHSGNSAPVGFAHLGFMVEDVDELVKAALEAGIYIIKNRGEGAFPQVAWLMDPDGYWIEIYQRCLRDAVIRPPPEEELTG